MVGMHAIGAQLSPHGALRRGHRGVQVNVSKAMRGGILAEPAVQGKYLRRRLPPGTPSVFRGGQHAHQHHADVMRLCQLGHGGQVALNGLQRHLSRVARNVIRPGQQHHNLGLQGNHILPEAHQHLRRSLSADSAVEIRPPGKERAHLRPFRLDGAAPALGDRVTHEDHTALTRRGCRHLGVGLAEASQFGPVTVQ